MMPRGAMLPPNAAPRPLVSIYIPTRGRRHLLERAVRSALRQSYMPLEVWVVVDGQDPESLSYLGSVDDDRLHVFARAESGGACAARNDAIRLAQGEWITGLDDDDELLPSHVETLVQAWQEHPGSFIATTSITKRRDGEMVRHAFEGPISLEALLWRNIVGNQVLTRTQYLRDLGGFDTHMPAWQDYDLWVRLTARFGPGFKLDARTYLQYQDHEAERISSAERILRAQKLFVSKHAALLSAKQVASLELQALANAHVKFSGAKLFEFTKRGLLLRALPAFVAARAPSLRNGVIRALRAIR
jgi:glycosyltransferase involved in cell wall biosynthesis